MEMQLYSRIGGCEELMKPYSSYTGLIDLKSCIEQCLKEKGCYYASFLRGADKETCMLAYEKNECHLDKYAALHITYQKIEKGKLLFWYIPIEF